MQNYIFFQKIPIRMVFNGIKFICEKIPVNHIDLFFGRHPTHFPHSTAPTSLQQQRFATPHAMPLAAWLHIGTTTFLGETRNQRNQGRHKK